MDNNLLLKLSRNTGHDFKTHPAIMIWATPLVRLDTTFYRSAVGVYVTMPFTIFTVDHVYLDPFPGTDSSIEKLPIITDLPSIKKPDYAFRLRPPFKIIIQMIATFFVHHRSFGISALI